MLAQLPWTQPDLDYHALAPEIVLAAVICGLLLIDLFLPERSKWALSTLAGLGLLASFVPIVLLAVSDDDVRSMFGGAYVVDDFALVLKALFVLSAYVIVLMSTNYIEEGEYYQGEYYFLLLTVGPRHGDDVELARPHQHLRGARVPVDPGLHARGVAQARREEQRGRHEVLPARRVLVGGDALRDVAVLRRHRHHAAGRDQPEPGGEREPRRR